MDEDNVELQKEVRAAFQDQADYQKFLAKEDFSYGLADVSDAEFNEHYESISSAMKGLGMEVQVVELATVPHAFLRDASLVEGEWIDAYVVALAEWGARLVQKGYVLEEPQDEHPFAWFRVFDAEGLAAGIEMQEKLSEQAKKHLAGFPGATREIEGRQYLNWADYSKWRGRWAKGDLKTGLRQGLALSQWNRWMELEQRDGKTNLDGTTVGALVCHADGYRYQVVDAQAEASRSRETLLSSMDVRNTRDSGELRLRSKALQWREMAEDYLGELYVLREAIDSINQRYFNGQPGLFPGSTHALSQLVEQAEDLVNVYNRNLAAGLEPLDSAVHGSDARGSENQHPIDLMKLRATTKDADTNQADYLGDMAKAEALDAMGEAEKAVQLVDRHLRTCSNELPVVPTAEK